jgi:hypothetical protein
MASLVSASFFVNASNAAISATIGIAIAERGGGQGQVLLTVACHLLQKTQPLFRRYPLIWITMQLL